MMKTYPSFSVLMSIYIKETVDNLRECIDSLLQQTVIPNEILIVKDGLLSVELDELLEQYFHEYPEIFTIVGYEENRGLGYALAYGLEKCRNELVARMDTDDVARFDRFEKQLFEFENDDKLTICGSHIIEFVEDIKEEKSRRKVPLENIDIINKGKLRDPFNHVTVMFKKSKVLEVGNYESFLLMEDSVLWAKLLIDPTVYAKNIDDYLVYVRAGDDMIARRGGMEYIIKYAKGRWRMYEIGYISKLYYYTSILIQMLVAMVPLKIRNFIFIKLLRG